MNLETALAEAARKARRDGPAPFDMITDRVAHREAERAALPRGGWTKEQDDFLMEAISNAVSLQKIASLIGRTKGSCQSRFRTLARQLGEVV